MPDSQDIEAASKEAGAAFAKADVTCPFGPSFFLGHLRRFVRDHCPPLDEHLPTVQIRLADGQTLDLCHVVGVSPRWAMLAIREAGDHANQMAIDFVPFEMIQGVRIRSRRTESTSAGFTHSYSPSVMTAETLVEAALASVATPAG